MNTRPIEFTREIFPAFFVMEIAQMRIASAVRATLSVGTLTVFFELDPKNWTGT